MAASLAYVVDRATYWSNASKALLHVVDLIKQADPEIAIAPQVQVRKARVLKDEGDLHERLINEIIQFWYRFSFSFLATLHAYPC